MNIRTVAKFLLIFSSFLTTVLTCEHDIGMHIVNCTSRGLTKVPSNTFIDEVTLLVLTQNSLAILENNVFGDYPDVTSLFLKKNNIKIVQVKAFQGLDKLVVLDLSYNKISFIYNTTFESNVNLEILNLSENPLHNLNPTNPLISSKSINILLLSKSNITSVTKHTFSGLQNLTFLDITSNSLNNIPSEFFKSLWNVQILLRGNPWICDDVEAVLMNEQDLIADYKEILCWTSDGEQRALSMKPTQTIRFPSSTRQLATSPSEVGELSSAVPTNQISTSANTGFEVTVSTSAKDTTVSPEKKETTKIDGGDIPAYGIVILIGVIILIVIMISCFVCKKKNKLLFKKSQPEDLQEPGVDDALLHHNSVFINPVFEPNTDKVNNKKENDTPCNKYP